MSAGWVSIVGLVQPEQETVAVVEAEQPFADNAVIVYEPLAKPVIA